MVTVTHLYLSPHLDDAILSCGGLIHRQRAAGEPVVVMNLCTGFPDDGQLSPLVQQYHAPGENPRDLEDSRRAEDRAVLAKWGVIGHYCEVPEGLYRRIDGESAYPDLAALYGAPHSQELDNLPGLWQQELEDIYADLGEVIVYAPLAVGNHVDHQLVRVLAERLLDVSWQVWFYEDYPYVERPDALQMALSRFGRVSWRAKTIPIDVSAKIAAIRGYRSQVSVLFVDEYAMIRRVKRFTAEVACSISLWERTRRRLAGSDGRRERLWRAVLGYHAHAERIWKKHNA